MTEEQHFFMVVLGRKTGYLLFVVFHHHRSHSAFPLTACISSFCHFKLLKKKLGKTLLSHDVLLIGIPPFVLLCISKGIVEVKFSCFAH